MRIASTRHAQSCNLSCMYRDDKEALQARADSATREADLLRRENDAMRRAVAAKPAYIPTLALRPELVYAQLNLRTLPLPERARLANHTLTPFPVWAVGILNLVTLGLFSLIHFGLVHDRLPRAASDDPSASKAIGCQFIPFYNYYWIFFNALRLSDRITLQFRLRGMTTTAPRGLLLAACVVTVIPYVGLLIGIPIVWTIAACMLQSSINQAAALSPNDWDAMEPVEYTSGPYVVPGAPN